MRKFRNAALVGNSEDTEKNYGISLTVPDQTLSVREIIDRYASGTLPDVMKGEEFYSEDLPDLRHLDMSELHELRQQARQDVKDLNEEIKNRKNPPPPPTDTSPTDDEPLKTE